MHKLTAARPDWGAALIDLREHGGSGGFEAPHTVRRAATDLETIRDFAPARAVLGHSFGGKVALAYAEGAPAGLEQVWVVDSTPSAREPGGSAWAMLHSVTSAPDRFESRAAAIDALVERGVERPVAQWMATNLEARGDVYEWRIDFDDMRALLDDFFELDAWRVIDAPPAGLSVHVVKATESSVLSDDDAERLDAARHAGRPVHLHTVRSGHWVNADNPDALVELLEEHLPGGEPGTQRG
jgi:pimeloyl-ACP methyl ester carboxylesterase